jgi:CRISPR-associated endonuclease/helicase Cas3
MQIVNRFFARAADGDVDTRLWQPLEEHLRGVGARAQGFAEMFDSGQWGRIAGLWHDLGKYQQEFQEKLRGRAISVEHSGAGAALAFQKDRSLGMPLAFAIAGHHAGLANFRDSNADARPLIERLKDNEPVISRIASDIPSDILTETLPSFPTFLPSPGGRGDAAPRRAMEFWVRMLFSALVDADRLDAERFATPERAEIRGQFVPIPELRVRLDAHIDAKIAALSEAVRASVVNSARAEVLAACRVVAEAQPGFFSLTVPTGGGKTLAGMSFALRHAERHGLRHAIVVIPYTSIIEQNAEEYRRALGAEQIIEHHSNLDAEKLVNTRGEVWATRQDLAAENWDAPVIVTTTVQFFESLLSNRPGRCRKLHNIARSVVILDEVQTLPPAFLETILDVLKELVAHYGCTVVLSTATPPALAARERFRGGLEGVRPIVANPETLTASLKRTDYTWPDPDAGPLGWETLADQLAQRRQALTVVHQRRDARDLARMLMGRTEPGTVFHLSALMCPAHRSNVLERVRTRLAANEPCLLVSTQLVEAGVDVDFPVVYRALGGLDSIVQAAGRCNREGRLERGEVVVFRAPSLPPPGTLRRALECMVSLLREFDGSIDPGDAGIFERYFRMLYAASSLDVGNIQRERGEFNFATVGRDFRLIEDDATETIIAPYGEAARRIGALRRLGPSRERLRALQPFTVSVYPQSFRTLHNAAALEDIADGLYVLVDMFAASYDPLFGLIVGDDPKVSHESLIV